MKVYVLEPTGIPLIVNSGSVIQMSCADAGSM
jgi:hypothetical protein